MARQVSSQQTLIDYLPELLAAQQQTNQILAVIFQEIRAARAGNSEP